MTYDTSIGYGSGIWDTEEYLEIFLGIPAIGTSRFPQCTEDDVVNIIQRYMLSDVCGSKGRKTPLYFFTVKHILGLVVHATCMPVQEDPVHQLDFTIGLGALGVFQDTLMSTKRTRMSLGCGESSMVVLHLEEG